MEETYEEHSKMAEWIVTHTDSISPEYVGQKLTEAQASEDPFLLDFEKEAARRNVMEARHWLKDNAEALGYQLPVHVDVTPKYPNHIMAKVRQKLGLEEYDTSKDSQINDMSKGEVFRACLEWEGIIGYEWNIRNWVEEIFGVKLE